MQDDRISVGLNNTPQLTFEGDPLFTQPQEDILDKIKNQQKFISKIYEFSSAQDNGFYTTEYLYGNKPDYLHRRLERTIRAEWYKVGDQTYAWVGGPGYTERVPVMNQLSYSTLDDMVVNNGTFTIERVGRYTLFYTAKILLSNMAGARMYILNYNTGEKYYLEAVHKSATLGVVADTEFTLTQRREVYIGSVPAELGPVIGYWGTTANGLPGSVTVKGTGGAGLLKTDGGTTFSIKKEIEWGLFRDYNM